MVESTSASRMVSRGQAGQGGSKASWQQAAEQHLRCISSQFWNGVKRRDGRQPQQETSLHLQADLGRAEAAMQGARHKRKERACIAARLSLRMYLAHAVIAFIIAAF